MLNVAVVGSGPAGLYAAEALVKQAAALPTPVPVRVGHSLSVKSAVNELPENFPFEWPCPPGLFNSKLPSGARVPKR